MGQTANSRLFNRALKVIPGGVNSPVRAFKAVGGRPIFIEKAKGAYMWDAAGRKYVDYCMSWGPMILGHARAEVLSAVRSAMERGTSYGVSTEAEVELAEMIVKAIPSIEKVRLVSSGTEAVMTAIRLARGATGRDKVLKFIGCYHGHVDHLLAAAGSGVMTLGLPGSPGVPEDFTKHTILVPYNDESAVKQAFARHGKSIAAAIVEPVAGNMGVVVPKKGFLKTIRSECTKHGSILVFDEVITGFRLTYGSVQSLCCVKADLTCLGKIIGGGFPIGACCGKAAIMDNLAPQGKVYQAGTLSGNPVCVAAGIATLKLLKELRPYSKLEKSAVDFCREISGIMTAKGVRHRINAAGSMWTLFFTADDVTDYDSAMLCKTDCYARFFAAMLKAGIYLPPSQFEACFLSTAHSQTDIQRTLEAIKKAELGRSDRP
jgi:glutamate-1-semialdehyde 2,1-aminomutase